MDTGAYHLVYDEGRGREVAEHLMLAHWGVVALISWAGAGADGVMEISGDIAAGRLVTIHVETNGAWGVVVVRDMVLVVAVGGGAGYGAWEVVFVAVDFVAVDFAAVKGGKVIGGTAIVGCG